MTKNKTNYETARDFAAHKEGIERETVLRRSEPKPYKHEESFIANYFGRVGGFNAGSDFGREYERAKSQKLLNAIKTINKYHNLSDAIYNVRENYGLEFEGNSWDCPEVLEYSKALDDIKAYEEDV